MPVKCNPLIGRHALVKIYKLMYHQQLSLKKLTNMRLSVFFILCLTLASCATKGTNPQDPFEPFNRKVHNFNMALDKVFLRPPAKIYRAVLPPPVRKSINNFYTNLDLIPTVGNDLLQAEGKWAIKDAWRFVINTTLGVGGLFDVAAKFSLPPHSNDLGLTFAKWGDRNSPYLVLPLLGPSTLRDGAGWLLQFALYSPYAYIDNGTVVYSLLALRTVDLRSQLLDMDRLVAESLDSYTFIRDAYLQHRNYLIAGTEQDTGALYVKEQKPVGSDYVQ